MSQNCLVWGSPHPTPHTDTFGNQKCQQQCGGGVRVKETHKECVFSLHFLNFIFRLFIVDVWAYNWFCILYPATLLNLFILIIFYQIGFFKFFQIQNHIICKGSYFYFFLFYLNPSISFSCLIALARTCTTMLNRRSRSTCLIPDLRESFLYLTIKYGIFCEFFSRRTLVD